MFFKLIVLVAKGRQGWCELWGRFSRKAGFSLNLKPRKPRVSKLAHGVNCRKIIAS